MENFAETLNSSIRNSFSNHNQTVVDDKFLSVFSALNYGSDYTIRNLIGLQKFLKSVGIEKSIEELQSDLTKDFNDDQVTVKNVKNNLNIDLKTPFVENQMKTLLRLPTLIEKSPNKLKILVDFSSPNIAKDMHVGHLRSTIIGDSICKLFEMQGHEVLRINHIGDYGLQFGMIIEHLLDKHPNYNELGLTISDLQNFYAESKKRFDTDETFMKNSYKRVVELQSGNEDIISAWNFIKHISRLSYNDIYDRLNIHLVEVGESYYQDQIPSLIAELTEKGLLEEDNGRQIIRVPGYDLPLTVVKSDGGYTYDTTDLAAIKYRLTVLNVDRIYYVIDNGQSLHLELLFKAAQMAGWLKTNQNVKHVGFGLVLGNDKKKFKSRDGNTVKLINLLEESLIKAEKVLDDHRKDHDGEDKTNIIRSVAYGSIKYADLSTMRSNDYIFSFDKMLSLKGNTGAYQLYEYVRICSILRNASKYMDEASQSIDFLQLEEKEEIMLCKLILQFPEIIAKISNDLMFHTLCSYLYDLTNAFSQFHIKCRCLNYNEKKELIGANMSRLLICLTTKMIMGQCFEILGLDKLEKM